MKRPVHKMFDRGLVASNSIIASSPINKAVFCVRGGDGSNGPCIGIDLGKSILIHDSLLYQKYLAMSLAAFYHTSSSHLIFH